MLVNTAGLAVEFEPQRRAHFLSTGSIRSITRRYLDEQRSMALLEAVMKRALAGQLIN